MTNMQYCKLLAKPFGRFKLPVAQGPYWFFRYTSALLNKPTPSQLKSLFGTSTFNTNKIRNELGLTFLDPFVTACDTAEALIALDLLD